LRPTIRREAIFASGTPVAFETYGTVRDDKDLAALDGKLNVDQTNDVEGFSQLARVRADGA
jgi:hypothetical protein